MIEVIPLDFMQQGALIQPVNQKLHDDAVEYCHRELANGHEVNLGKFSKVWVGLKDREVFGILGYVLKVDIPMMRATDADVLRALGKRINDYLADNGSRGHEVFVHIGCEKPEQRCPQWSHVLLKDFAAKPANRFSIEVK